MTEIFGAAAYVGSNIINDIVAFGTTAYVGSNRILMMLFGG
jgi:hypothetical protein